MNAGQTCVACDYLFVHSNVKEEFLKLLKEKIIEFFGQDASKSPDYVKIITENHTKRLGELLNE